MTRPFLKRLGDELEAAFTAAAFAEEREVETARAILSLARPLDAQAASFRR